MALGVTPLARADTDDEKRQADQRVAELHSSLEGTSTELANAYLSLQQTQAQVPAAEAALANANAKAKAAAAHQVEVSTKLAVAKANEARAVEAAAKNAAALDATQRTLDAFAADMFQGGTSSELSVALGATSPDDFATGWCLLTRSPRRPTRRCATCRPSVPTGRPNRPISWPSARSPPS